MVQQIDKRPSVIRSLDWVTICLYIVLLAFGWISVCGASYTYGDSDILSGSSPWGMVVEWSVTSLRFSFDSIHKVRDAIITFAIILVPLMVIVLQRETGSALVYLSFMLMFYREGMPGSVLFTGVAAVVYFVVGIRYEDVMLWSTPTSLGKFVVLLLVQLFSAGMVYVYCNNKKGALSMAGYCLAITLLFMLFSEFVIPFDIVWVELVVTAVAIGWLLWLGLG